MSKLIINYTSCFYTTIDQSYWLHVEVFWESTEVTTVTLKKTIINEFKALLVTLNFSLKQNVMDYMYIVMIILILL